MARLAVGMVFGIVVGVIGGAALQIHAASDGGMGAESDLTGVDGSDQAAVPELTDVVPDPTVETPRAQQSDALPETWRRLAQCEASGNWQAATGNGYYGGLQFDLPSWRAAGGSGRPDQASPAEQIRVGQNWQRMRGWSAWPVCSRVIGVR